MELYIILIPVQFTISKEKLYISYSKLGIGVASRVAERLKTYDLRKLGIIEKISTLDGDEPSCLVSFQEVKLCK